MNRDYFLRELEYLLSDVAEEEKQEALQYYRDFLDEAGPEKEQEVLAHLGSPEKVAAEIKGGLSGNDGGGEFTERGYRDVRFEESYRVPDQYGEIVEAEEPQPNRKKSQKRHRDYEAFGQNGSRHFEESGSRRRSDRENRTGGLVLLLLFVIFGLPLAGTIISGGFSIVAAIVGALFGIFGGLLGLLAGVAAAAFGLVVSGIRLIISGCYSMASPAIGTMTMGLGFFSLAGAMLLLIAAKWGFTTAVPGVFRFSVELARRAFGFAASLIRRIFHRGGEEV